MSASPPGHFYNYTNDGKPVAFSADSELAKINVALQSGLSAEEVLKLVTERERLLRFVVDASSESFFRRYGRRRHF